ncbi:membrane protein [Bacteroidia bacterium]|nr:membrane protein [Bacteroidia bacterium]GHV19753.1 membrane protein [Bacteroidia bacterium]
MPRPNGVYTVYGHTAIRVFNPAEKIDVVFNYGTFDFNSPNFIYRFVKGETDYSISADDYRLFEYHYSAGNAIVVEQILNIPAKNKEEIVNALIINMKPENRKYRYNYFFDNCTTRPRDIIEKYCGGKLLYSKNENPVTFRKLIHECTLHDPWMTFGIDLVIGNGADSIIGKRSELFLPVKLMEALDEAYVEDADLQQYPIVSSSKTIIRSEPINPSKSWSSPMKLGIVMAIHCLVFAIVGFFWKKTFRFFYCLIFMNVAIAGCIVAFVALISSHPCTWPNWNLLWIHPLHFIPAIGYFFKKTYHLIRWYHWSNFVLLSGILLGWSLIPQELNIACIPFIICLWISSGYKLLIDKKLNK